MRVCLLYDCRVDSGHRHTRKHREWPHSRVNLTGPPGVEVLQNGSPSWPSCHATIDVPCAARPFSRSSTGSGVRRYSICMRPSRLVQVFFPWPSLAYMLSRTRLRRFAFAFCFSRWLVMPSGCWLALGGLRFGPVLPSLHGGVRRNKRPNEGSATNAGADWRRRLAIGPHFLP